MANILHVPWRPVEDDDEICPFLFLHHLWSAGKKELQDHLLQNFQKVGDDSFDFFLPQICVMLITWEPQRCASLERFFLEKCMNSIHFALKSFWYIHACMEYTRNKEHVDRCESLRQDIETVVVNSKLPPKFYVSGKKIVQKRNIQEHDENAIIQRLMFKQRIAEYFNSQLDLIIFFENLATRLADYAPEHRQELLVKNLEHLSSHLMNGLYFPLQHSANLPHLTLQCPIADEGRIMSSKAKVPFLMVWEVNESQIPVCDSQVPKLLSAPGKKGGKVKLPPPDTPSAAELRKELAAAALMEEPSDPEYEEEILSKSDMDDNHDIRLNAPMSAEEIGESLEKLKRIRAPENRPKVTPRDRRADSEPHQWNPFRLSNEDRKEAWKHRSKVAKLCPRWDVQTLIFKHGEDLRQEALCVQFIHMFDAIFRDAKLPIQMKPFSIVCTSPYSGLVECLVNCTTVTRIRENCGDLFTFWESHFGPRGSTGYIKATKNFIESLVGYSLFSYILQIKDRHNGNIMVLNDGCIAHIDFGFMFTNSPGGNSGFESSPFKFPEDYIEILGGEDSEDYNLFQVLMLQGFLTLRRHLPKFVLMTEIMLEGSPMPCFIGGKERVITELKQRMCENLSNEDCITHVMSLIEQSVCNWRTQQYDSFQKITNGIY